MAPYPAVDIVDNEADIWVSVDIPGFQKEEIRIRTDQNTLVLAADRENELADGSPVVLNEWTTYVERNIPLPVSVRPNGAQATYEDGVCKVTLPKAATDRYEETEFTSD